MFPWPVKSDQTIVCGLAEEGRGERRKLPYERCGDTCEKFQMETMEKFQIGDQMETIYLSLFYP